MDKADASALAAISLRYSAVGAGEASNNSNCSAFQSAANSWDVANPQYGSRGASFAMAMQRSAICTIEFLLKSEIDTDACRSP